MFDRVRQVGVFVFIVLDILSSLWLGNSLDQQPGGEPVYFLPSGLTFAIWGVIFTSQFIYAVYQLQPAQTTRRIHRQIGGWVALNAALTALWNITAGTAQQSSQEWQVTLTWGTVLILAGMLFSLTQVFIVFRQMHADLTARDRLFAVFPFIVFFAWLNVAMIANSTAALNASGFTGGQNGALWGAGMLLVAALLASTIIRLTRLPLVTFSYAGVIIWAVLGILLNNVQRSPLIVVTCIMVMAVIAVGAVIRTREQQQHPLSPVNSPRPA